MLRTSYTVALMLAVLLAGAYWYTSVEAVCRLPVYYSLGALDYRFGLSEDEARTHLSEAESIWEEATGRNLFTYDDSADLKVNFIYDERQQSADAADAAKDNLDDQATINDTLSATYAALVAEYDKQELIYQDQKAAYERRLNVYNAKVNEYNESGGAPPDVYEELEAERQELDAEREAVNAQSDKLNELSQQINDIGEQGNRLIEQYNERVRRFNDTFGHTEEFTQGDYRGRSINIYSFQDDWELQLVLAHEFGHALSLDHVENDASIMYYLLGGQPADLETSLQDVTEFQAVCGDVTTYQRLRERVLGLLERYGVI